MGKRRRRKAKAANSDGAAPAGQSVAAWNSIGQDTERPKVTSVSSQHSTTQKPGLTSGGPDSAGQGGRRARKQVNKQETPETSLDKIRLQLEFYFSTANLRRDRFMKRTLDAGAGWIDLSTILTFNRIKAMHCRDVSRLAAAVQKSEILKLSADSTKVQRDLEKAPMDTVDPAERTIYVEGLPLCFGIDDLAKFFAHHGHVKLVELPHHRETGEPRGYGFIQFSTESEATQSVTALDGTWPSSWQQRYDGKALRVMLKSSWLKCAQEYKQLQQTARAARPSICKATSSMQEIGSSVEASRIPSAAQGSAKITDNAQHSKPPLAGQLPLHKSPQPRQRPGCLVMISGFPQPQTLLSVRHFAEHAVPVEFCDFPDPYASRAFLRLRTPEDCRVLLQDVRLTQRMLGWQTPQVRVLQPHEEEEYWQGVQIRRAERNAAASRSRPRSFSMDPAGLSKRAKRRQVRPLRAMMQNPQGVVRRGPGKTTAIKRWSPGKVQHGALDGFKDSFSDTVGGNGRFVQAGFGRRRPGRRRAFESLVPLSAGRVRKLSASISQGVRNSDAGKQQDASGTMQDEPPLKVMRRSAPQQDASALRVDELPSKGGGRRAAPIAGSAPSKDKQASVPPPSPFIMPGKDKPKRSATKTSGNERGTTSAWIPPPSPYARPASSAKPKSPHRPSIPPPSPVAKPPSHTSQPSVPTVGVPEAEGQGDGVPDTNLPEDSSKTRADSMLNDTDDILGLLD